MKTQYENIKSYFDEHRHSNERSMKNSKMLKEIEEFVDIEHIKGCYPKNLFVEDRLFEMYVVLEDKLIRGIFAEEDKIELQILRFDDIIDFRCECICGPSISHKLLIEFKNKQIVEWDSSKDTNNGWVSKFEKQIKDLTKTLINR